MYIYIHRISPSSVQKRENTDQKNSEYGQFSGSANIQFSVGTSSLWLIYTFGFDC